MRPLETLGLVWMDGKMVRPEDATVKVVDPSVQAGLGVFETIALRGGLPLDLPEHILRLEGGARALSVALPSADVLAAAVRSVAAQFPDACGFVKITALRGGPAVVYGGRMDAEEEGRPVAAVLLDWRQNTRDAITGLKTWNYASHILGLEEARRRDADEGIWLNSRGHLAEGCTSTLFVVHRRRVFTPALADGILPGITRGVVLVAARELGYVVHEGKVRLKKLLQADEAFLTSSLRAVRPLVRLDGRAVKDGLPGPVTKRLAKEVEHTRIERARAREQVGRHAGMKELR